MLIGRKAQSVKKKLLILSCYYRVNASSKKVFYIHGYCMNISSFQIDNLEIPVEDVGLGIIDSFEDLEDQNLWVANVERVGKIILDLIFLKAHETFIEIKFNKSSYA